VIGIVDYGVGNVRAFANIYKRLNIPAILATEPAHLESAQRVILPGVGAFDWAMRRLEQSGLRAPLERAVVTCKKPVLGICVGMQMLADGSDEGTAAGLGWIRGRVRKFDETIVRGVRLPHMGWNDVHVEGTHPLFAGLESGARFYFLHSYYYAPAEERCVVTRTDYHGSFASGVGEGNAYGVQFHPEKSHEWGIRLLKNFAEI
jgi:glutamine amidotransferase